MDQQQERMYEAIGSAIRARREELKLTQGQLADLVNLSRASVTNIECGRQSLLVDQLCKFAQALNTTPIELLPNQIPPSPLHAADGLSPEANAWIERLRRSS